MNRAVTEISPDEADVLARARAVAPLIAEASDRIEREREIPSEVISAMHDARLFRMLIPRSCDGDEVHPTTFFQAIEVIAMADASAAWCVGQGGGAVMASGPGSPSGKAVAVEGGSESIECFPHLRAQYGQ